MLKVSLIKYDSIKRINFKHNQEGLLSSKYGIITIIDHNSVIEYEQKAFAHFSFKSFWKYFIQNNWFKTWAFPFSLAVTKGILVSFLSSAYWYA